MAFQIDCKCGETLILQDKMKGKKFKCPHCSLVISLKFKTKAQLEELKKLMVDHNTTTTNAEEDSQPILLNDDSEPILLTEDSEPEIQKVSQTPKEKPKKKPPPIPRKKKKKKVVYDDVEVVDYDDVEIIDDDY